MSKLQDPREQGWAQIFEVRLQDLGIDPRQAATLTSDSLAEARAARRTPDELFGSPSVYAHNVADSVHATRSAEPLPRVDGAVVLALTEVSKRYRRRTVLAPTSLTVREGEIAVVVGANGAGKSTLINICAGRTAPTSGSIARTAEFSHVPQFDALSPYLTVQEHMDLFGSAAGMRRAHARATGAQLCRHLSWSPRLDLLTARLSGGTRQKLSVALAELSSPRLLLLDEPYQGFDHSSYRRLWEQLFRLRDRGVGILMVTHLLHDLDDVDQLIELTPAEEDAA